MSTTINVALSGGDDLVSKVQAQQQVARLEAQEQRFDNRNSQSEQAAAETVPDGRQQRLLEPTTPKQKLAANRESVGMGAWLHTNYTLRNFGPVIADYAWMAGDQIQFSVGCGDGTKWETVVFDAQYANKNIAITSTAPVKTVYGECIAATFNTQAKVAQADLPANAEIATYDPRPDPNNFGAIKTNIFPGFYTFQFQQKYGVYFTSNNRTDATYQLYPIDDKKAVFIIYAQMGYYRQDRYGGPVCLDDKQVAGPGNSPIQGYNGGYAYLYTKYVPNNDAENTYMPIIGYIWDQNQNTYGLINPVENFEQRRQAYAFTIGHNKVKQVSVPTTLLAQLEQRFPPLVQENEVGNNLHYLISTAPDAFKVSDDLEPALTDSERYLWNQNPHSYRMGASPNARIERATGDIDDIFTYQGLNWDFWPDICHIPSPYIMGSPGIYDWVDTGMNDWALTDYNNYNGYTKIGGPQAVNYPPLAIGSAYVASPPLFTFDHTQPKSAFQYLNAKNTLDEIYYLKFLYLKQEDRNAIASFWDSFADANYKAVTLNPPPNSEFYYCYYHHNNPQIAFSNSSRYKKYFTFGNFSSYFGQGADSFKWLTTDSNDLVQSTYEPTVYNVKDDVWVTGKQATKLSPARIYPPSLWQNNPFIYKSRNPPVPNSTFLDNPFLTHDAEKSYLSLLSWTGWGKSWKTQLIALGFKASDLVL